VNRNPTGSDPKGETMSTLRGTLVIAGVVAAAVGVGCAHEHEKKTRENMPPSATEVTTPPATPPVSPTAPEPGLPGTEMGTGGAGQSTGGFPSSTPSTTTPRQPSTGNSAQDHETNPSQPSSEQGIPNSVTSPGTGGSGMEHNRPGMDVNHPEMDPEACNRNQIGSPGSSDVICDQNSSSSSSTSPDTGTPGISGDVTPKEPEMNSGMGGSGVDQSGNTTTETKTQTKTKTKKKTTKQSTDQSTDTVP
jgi:hypothetical protein